MKPVFDDFSEPQTDRRKFLLGALFCAAAGVAAFRQPSKHLDYLGKNKLEDVVPKRIGDWNFVAASGLVVPPEDQLSQTLYSQLLTRVYDDGKGPAIMLLLAQSGSQTGFLQIHRPETCYTAGGYKILSMGPHPIQVGSKIIPANVMNATSGGAPEHIAYWTRVGDEMPQSWKAQRIAVAEQNLRGVIPDAILVRISTVSDDGDAAMASIDRFVRAMLASVPPNLVPAFIA